MICFSVTAPHPPQWHMVTFHRSGPQSYEVHRQTFLFQAAMRRSANRWHYSKADCTMIGTITVVLTRQGICGSKKQKKKRIEEVNQEQRHSIRQQPVGLLGWFMAAILCQNLTTNQFAMKRRLTLTPSRDKPSGLRRVSEVWKSSEAAARNTHWKLFFICQTHQLLFPCSSLIIQS